MFKTTNDTFFIGKNIIHLPSCQSTNSEAVKLIQEGGVQEGTIVITSQQTAGKGQRGNSWHSESGKNLTFSLILKPSFLLAYEQFNLNIAISLAVWDALSEYLPHHKDSLKVKWPNDIYIGNQKVGGILIENFIKKQKAETSVVGIGLNINQQSFDLPKATSLFNVLRKETSLENILNTLMGKLEKRFIELRNGNASMQRQAYLSTMYWFQEEHLFADLRGDLPKNFEGQIIGIDKTGRLAMEVNGKLDYFHLKEVSFIA